VTRAIAPLVLALTAAPLPGQSPPLRISDRPSSLEPRPLPPSFTTNNRSILPPASWSSPPPAAGVGSTFPSGGLLPARATVTPNDGAVRRAFQPPPVSPGSGLGVRNVGPAAPSLSPPAAPVTGSLLVLPTPGSSAPAAPNAGGPAPVTEALVEDLLRFQPATLTLKRVGDRWQLWAENALVLDCGPLQVDALEAQRLIRALEGCVRGTLGSPRTALTYWLADGGRPPERRNFTHAEVPLDRATLRVEQFQGLWWLRDARNLVANFGTSEADARTALAVCRRYGFNRVGFVGRQRPVLTYFVADPHPLPQGGPGQSLPDPSRVGVLPQMCSRESLPLQGVGYVGELVRFDPRQVVAVCERGDWRLDIDGLLVARFGHQQSAAEAAVRAVRDYRLTQYVRIGDPAAGQGLGFFLSDGAAPFGVRIGLDARRFPSDRLDVFQAADGSWWVTAAGSPQWRFPDEASCRQAVAAVRALGFNTVCHLGPTDAGLSLLVRGN
jgi:hypothetical protein